MNGGSVSSIMLQPHCGPLPTAEPARPSAKTKFLLIEDRKYPHAEFKIVTVCVVTIFTLVALVVFIANLRMGTPRHHHGDNCHPKPCH